MTSQFQLMLPVLAAGSILLWTGSMLRSSLHGCPPSFHVIQPTRACTVVGTARTWHSSSALVSKIFAVMAVL